VDTFSEMLDLAMVLADGAVPPGRRVAVVCNAGGHGVLTADACEAAGLDVPVLAASTQDRLREFLPALRSGRVADDGVSCATANPVDLDSTAFGPEYRRGIPVIAADPNVDALLVIFTPPPGYAPERMAAPIADALAGTDATAVACIMGARGRLPEFRPSGPGRRIPAIPTTERAALALARAADYGAWQRRPLDEPRGADGADLAGAGALIDDFLTRQPEGGWLDAPEAVALATAAGIPVVLTTFAADPDAAVVAAGAFAGPVALKAAAGDLVHKTDVGAVALGLGIPAAVRDAAERILALAPDGVVVQPMAAPGVETIVGGLHDDLFGPVVMFGFGGVLTDLWNDRSFALAPPGAAETIELIRTRRGFPLLDGYRGGPVADLDALARVVDAVGALVSARPEIAELDLNPVVASPAGAVALDVKIRLFPVAP
jgi:acyl-CoA synthetase (NDP forming)